MSEIEFGNPIHVDYEKKYKKALVNARQEYNTTENVERKHWLEELFPELAESEDERIRKALLEYFGEECDTATINGIYCYKIYEWLEKQGEPIKIKKGKNYLCTKTHRYAGEEWIEGVKYYSPEDYSLVNQGCTCYCPKYSKEEHNNFFREVEYDGCLEKQGETALEAIHIVSNPQVVCPYCKNTNCAYIDGHWFCPYCCSEFHTKWCEEDDGVVDCLKSHIKQYLNDEAYTSYRRWLESLKQRMEE